MDPKAASDLVANPGKLCGHEERAKYLRLLGKLMWVCNTRPDIAFAVNKLASFSSEIVCSTNHWKALLRVLTYISGTLEHGIMCRHAVLLIVSIVRLRTNLSPHALRPYGEFSIRTIYIFANTHS